MKQLPLFFSACMIITFSACSSKKSKTTEEQKKSVDVPTEAPKMARTANHIKIPNSSLYIIPPAGFAANETTGTITTEEGHPDMLVMKFTNDISAGKIISDQKALADKEYPGSWKEDEIKAGGHLAKIYHIKSRFGTQYYFSFADGHSDEMIIVNYDENDMATAKQLYEALKTVVVEK